MEPGGDGDEQDSPRPCLKNPAGGVGSFPSRGIFQVFLAGASQEHPRAAWKPEGKRNLPLLSVHLLCHPGGLSFKGHPVFRLLPTILM